MPWQITALLVSSVFELVLAFWVRARMRTPVATPFFLALLLNSSWALGYAIELLTPGYADKLLIFQIRCTLLCFYAPAWLEMAHRLTFGRPLLRGWMIPAVMLVPAVTEVLLWWSGPGEQATLLRHSFWLDNSGGLPVLRDTLGPWGHIYYIYNYAAWLAIGLMLLPRRRQTEWERHGQKLFLAAAALGWTLDLAHLAGLTKPTGLNYAPIFLTVTSALVTYAMWRHRLIELAPVARAALLERLEDRILVFDERDQLIDANAAALATFAWSRSAMQRKRAADALAAWPALAALFTRTDGRAVEVLVGGVAFDATRLDICDERDDHLRARVLVLRDISARKKIENQLRQATATAVAAEQAQSRFLATMSHEIRTPMNGVVGFTEMLQQTPLAPEQREYLDLIGQSASSLLVIINDVLDYSKIVADRLEIEQVPSDIPALVARTGRLLRPLAQRKHLELSCEVADDVPAVVVSDPVRLQQILTNLLGNAIKFTERGSVRLEVRAAADERIVFTISDTGIGIAPEQQERIFEPFSQADASTTRRFGGTGLGLSIARRLCELLGGSLTLQSELHRGSTFTAIIRAVRAPTPPPALAQAKAMTATNGAVARRLRVLVFEDNPVNRKLTSLFLTKLRHEAQFAENGAAGLAILEQHRFDVLLMDLEMPVLDGYETARRIRATEAATGAAPVHIIALTAHAQKEQQERCLALGMNDFLTKPLTLAELEQALARVAPLRVESSPAGLQS